MNFTISCKRYVYYLSLIALILHEYFIIKCC